MANVTTTGTAKTRIGYGLVYPLRRGHGDFDAASGKRLLTSCARKVIMTRRAGSGAAGGGEYPWRLNFGSFVYLIRHSNWQRLVRSDMAVVFAAEAVLEWEPRIFIATDRAEITPSRDDRRKLQIRLYYSLDDELGGDARLSSEQDQPVEITA